MAAFLELDFTYEILGVAQEYGLDSYSTPQVIAFALELLEAGILTDKDFPEMPADSRGRFFYLLEKIVRREGIRHLPTASPMRRDRSGMAPKPTTTTPRRNSSSCPSSSASSTPRTS
jgi:hypothetical protein